MNAAAARPRRVCLVRLSALGDVCLVVPLVRVLQKAWPETQLTWVIGREALPIVQDLCGIQFVVLDKREGWRGYLSKVRTLGREDFDVLLALQASLRANLLYPWIRAPRKIGFDRLRAKDAHGWFINESIPPARQHFVDAYLSFARMLGLESGPPTWDLPLRPGDRDEARRMIEALPRPLIAVNPSASKAERNWPLERYVDVLRDAVARWHCGIVLTGGHSPLEQSMGEQLVADLGPGVPVVNAIGRASLSQTLALLAQADVLLTPDSGPAHFADALGTPVVGLYAVAPAALSGPYRSRHLVVDKFDEAARRFLGREAASLPWNMRIRHPGAMPLITVEEVRDRLSQALASGRLEAGTLQ